MKNITTYCSSRRNIFIWLAVLLSAVSAVTRFIALSGVGSEGFFVMVVHMLLPLVANLFIIIRLPWRCGEMYYVTVGPVVLLAIYFGSRVIHFGFNLAMTISCLFLCIIQAVAFSRTFKGKINTKLVALGAYLLPCFFAMDVQFRQYLSLYFFRVAKMLVVTDLASWLSVICIILAAKKLPEPKEGDPYRRKWGDRMDGRRVRSLMPISALSTYFMPTRVESTNAITDSVEIANAEKYIHEKRREGLKHFGMTHLLIAAYTRTVAELPQVNRFIAGQKIFSRFEIICSMIIKKDMDTSSPETMIKVHLTPKDTAYDVYEKYDALVQDVKATEELSDKGFDGFTKLIQNFPSIILAIGIMAVRVLDYFGLCPYEVFELSPFHGSMFITSMGSLGIPPINHHLYNFGNISQFCAFGAKRTERSIAADGSIVTRKYIDMVWDTDERICDGFYYSQVLKRVKYYVTHPELLDVPPEEVKEDVD